LDFKSKNYLSSGLQIPNSGVFWFIYSRLEELGTRTLYKDFAAFLRQLKPFYFMGIQD
jgi:hypothetical protein